MFRAFGTLCREGRAFLNALWPDKEQTQQAVCNGSRTCPRTLESCMQGRARGYKAPKALIKTRSLPRHFRKLTHSVRLFKPVFPLKAARGYIQLTFSTSTFDIVA